MKKEQIERVYEEGRYIVRCGSTIRETAKVFGVSKTTVHKDVTERLKSLNILLYNGVQEVIKKNKAERHIRGGEALRLKHLNHNKKFAISQK